MRRLVLAALLTSSCACPFPGHARFVAAPTKACAGGLPLIVDDVDAGPP